MNMHIPVPPKRIVALGGPVTAAIAVMRAEERRTIRARLAARIEADLLLLDQIDGDADLEDGGDDEPSFGLPCDEEREADDSEREADDSDLEDNGDHEDSLGSLQGTAASRGASQWQWSGGQPGDCEAQPEDDNDVTAPERFGGGFVRCAADDAEDGHNAEGMTDDNGLGDGMQEQMLRDELEAA
ncbi:MAG: hypothetical protein WAP03_12800 [Methylorubrum rhodinum]|uniref:hypothetical protein n=1 Tax=Methylorubrum rhodinum TaxID=29428 RepID=UPI003BAE6968